MCVLCELCCLVNGMDAIEILSGMEAQPEQAHVKVVPSDDLVQHKTRELTYGKKP